MVPALESFKKTEERASNPVGVSMSQPRYKRLKTLLLENINGQILISEHGENDNKLKNNKQEKHSIKKSVRNPAKIHWKHAQKTIAAPCPFPCLLGTRKAPSGPSLPPTWKDKIFCHTIWKRKKDGRRSNRPFAMNVLKELITNEIFWMQIFFLFFSQDF